MDHKSKTISCDLFELLVKGQTQEDDIFDGQALELANSTCIHEHQTVELVDEKVISSSSDDKLIKRVNISLK